MGLVSTVLHFREGLCLVLRWVFADADYASKATDRRSMSREVIMCEGASVYWFQDSKMRYPFDFRSRVHCSRGCGKGGIVFEIDLAFCVAQ